MGEQALSSGVGVGQPNVAADVMTVQALLDGQTAVAGIVLIVDGDCGPNTVAAIKLFQGEAMGMGSPDGVVGAGGPTFLSLVKANGPGNASTNADVPVLLQPQMPVPVSVLEEADYAAAAQTLGCEVAAIQAVAMVECSGQAFDGQGRPTILFEPRVFSNRTKHVWDVSDISDKNFDGKSYGPGAAQYPKLVRAAALGEGGATLAVALESASWGMFQIMGFNCGLAGYATGVEDFVTAMRTGVGAHLQAFVSFIARDGILLKAIQEKQWTSFAREYNGKNFAQNNYDGKLAAAYAKLTGS
jgi:hypothetical protein